MEHIKVSQRSPHYFVYNSTYQLSQTWGQRKIPFHRKWVLNGFNFFQSSSKLKCDLPVSRSHSAPKWAPWPSPSWHGRWASSCTREPTPIRASRVQTVSASSSSDQASSGTWSTSCLCTTVRYRCKHKVRLTRENEMDFLKKCAIKFWSFETLVQFFNT